MLVLRSWICAMVRTIVMMSSSTGVMVQLFLAWLDCPKVVGVTPEGPAPSLSWCEGCEDCEAQVAVTRGVGGSQQQAPHQMGRLIGPGTGGLQSVAGPVETQ